MTENSTKPTIFQASRLHTLRLAGLLVLLLLGFIGSAGAQSCGDILYANTTLTHDLVGCPGTGLTLGEDIVLDLNGHTVSGSGGSVGIAVNPGINDAQVVGPGTVKGFATGFWAQDNERLLVQGVSFFDNHTVGITLYGVAYSTVEGNGIFGSLRGILLQSWTSPADKNKFFDNQVADCLSGGIRLDAGDRHEVRGNTIKGCEQGVELLGTSEVVVHENVLFDNTTGVVLLSHTGPMANNVVANNKVFDNETGIKLSSGAAAIHPLEETFVGSNTLQGGTWGVILDDPLCIDTYLIQNEIWGTPSPITDLGTSTLSSGNSCDGAPC